MNERDAFLVLNAMGLTNYRVNELIICFGSAQNVLSASAADLTSRGLTEETAGKIIHFDKEIFLQEELKLIKQHDVDIVTFQDDEYPSLLKNIVDAPVVLYFKGTLKTIDSPAVAIVGSRKASVYGMNTAEKLAISLAEVGISVVSGMARGIDTSAHQGALKAQGLTIAVLGSGLATIYPPENKKLFDGIMERGVVLSEFPMTTPPLAYNFPRRNRIISGLSLGVIVVEAFKKSGALITSRLAAEQGREVFAVPGNIDTPQSQGPNYLIQQGVKLVMCLQDILEEIKPHLRESLGTQMPLESKSAALPDLTEEERRIYESLGLEAVHMDILIDRLQVSLPQLFPILLNLQLKNLIKELPGKYFARK